MVVCVVDGFVILLWIFLISLWQVFGAHLTSRTVEFPLAFEFILLQHGYQFAHNVLHGAVKGNVVEWVGLVDDDVTGGTSVAFLEVLH